MPAQMKDTDLARLHVRFVLPVVVSRMLTGQEEFDEIAEHAINEILTEHRPDTALLCIALCAQHIAAEVSHIKTSHILSNGASRLIEDYGSLWLAHEDELQNATLNNTTGTNADLDPKRLYELLEHLPEDLESIADLLDATIDELEEEHHLAAILADIICGQARMHQEVAEIELGQINPEAFNIKQEEMQLETPQSFNTASAANLDDNVVVFPGKTLPIIALR